MTLGNKHLRKLILILAASSLLFGVAVVRAQSPVEVWLQPLQGQVRVGETVTIQLMVKAQVAVGGYDLTLAYDPKLLLLDSWKYGDFLSALYEVKKEDTPGQLRLVSVQLAKPPIAGEGKLLEFTFRGLAMGTSELTLTDVTLANATGNQYVAGTSNGSIKVMAGNTQTPTATSTPSTPYPLPATTTRTPLPIQPGVAAATATLRPNLTSTAQALLATTLTFQSTDGLATPELQESGLENTPIGAEPTPTALISTDTGIRTDPILIPVRPEKPSDNSSGTAEDISKPGILTGIIVFDVVALLFVIFLVWKRRRKTDERSS